MNKKGFTIVELVIVIAVIAILAAVLIPTFSGIVDKAKDSATIQEARNLYTEYVGLHDYKTGSPDTDVVIKTSDNKYVAVVDSSMKTVVYASEAAIITANIGITDANYTLVSKTGDTLSAVKNTQNNG